MQPFQLKVDQFHHTFIQFPEQFHVPHVGLSGLDSDQRRGWRDVVRRAVPSFVHECDFLPENRPARRIGEVQFAREHRIEDRSYIYIFRALAEYRGGAESREVQGNHSLLTNRIYYLARLLPVATVRRTAGRITDFEPRRLAAVFQVMTSMSEDKDSGRRRVSAAAFDEQDHKPVNETYRNLLDKGENWKHGSLFEPFVTEDYLTLSLNLAYPAHGVVEQVLPHFDGLIRGIMDKDASAGDDEFWRAYFSSFAMESVLSRAGNPHRLIKKCFGL